MCTQYSASTTLTVRYEDRACREDEQFGFPSQYCGTILDRKSAHDRWGSASQYNRTFRKDPLQTGLYLGMTESDGEVGGWEVRLVSLSFVLSSTVLQFTLMFLKFNFNTLLQFTYAHSFVKF